MNGGRGRVIALRMGAVVALLLSVNLLGVIIDALTGAPGGRPSSSFSTAPDGVEAYAELLGRSGFDVTRVRAAPRDASFAPGAAVFVLDPGELSGADARALGNVASTGGRLVVAVNGDAGWLDEVIVDPPTWTPGGPQRAVPVAPAPETAHIAEVAFDGLGTWSDARATLPLLGEGNAVLTAATSGSGRVLLLADSSPLHNRLLRTADDAALGLRLAGAPGGRVYFVESVHGYGTATGLAALPGRVKLALGALMVGGLLWMAAHARRLGPPERAGRPLPPARRAYVDALGRSLQRTRDPAAAIEPLRRAARSLLIRRGQLHPDASDDELGAAARRAGLNADESAGLLGGASDDRSVVAAGRAFARLNGGTG